MSGERYNAATIIDANLEAGRGERTALFFGDERITYGQLFGRVSSMARALKALGVGRESRVLLLLADTPAFAVAFFGALRAGASATLAVTGGVDSARAGDNRSVIDARLGCVEGKNARRASNEVPGSSASAKREEPAANCWNVATRVVVRPRSHVRQPRTRSSSKSTSPSTSHRSSTRSPWATTSV